VRRREFIVQGSAALAATAWSSCAALEIVDETEASGAFDVLFGTPESSDRIAPLASSAPGSYAVRMESQSSPRIVVVGADPEGARNGLYAFMEHLGFRFFRDGNVVPELRGHVILDVRLDGTPAFRWRGDMIWDNYLVPFLLAEESLALSSEMRRGALEMSKVLAEGSSSFVRDFMDLLTWIALRQAQTFEADAYLHHREGEPVSFEPAREAWSVLHGVLSSVPELSILESARAVRRVGALSARAEDSLWTLACDFYRGYPLVMSPEAVELCYQPQLDALERLVRDAETRGETASLEAPGWFWHDFPVRAWAESVRKLPSEDGERFERVFRERLREALAEPTPAERELDLAAIRVMLVRPLPEKRGLS